MGKEEAAKREAEAKAKAEAEAKARPSEGKAPTPGSSAPPAPGVPERTTLPDSDRATLYSGPTIVDDDKVADALKKLRLLDDPAAGASANVSLSVVDANSSEVTRVAAPSERARPATPAPVAVTPSPAPVPRLANTTPSGKTGTLWGWMPSQESDDSGRTPAPPPRTPVASEVTAKQPTSEASRQTAQRSGLLVDKSPTPRPAEPPRVAKAAPRPTAIGHSTSTPPAGSAVGQASDDRAFKGTMHGHSLHLPVDAPDLADDAKLRTATTPVAGNQTIVAGNQTIVAGNQTIHAAPTVPEAAPATNRGLSQRTSGVVEAQPPRPRRVEARRKRPKGPPRVVIFVAVVSTFVVGAFAWVRLHQPEPAPRPRSAMQQLEQEEAEPANPAPPSPTPGTAAANEEPAPAAGPAGAPAPADQPAVAPSPALDPSAADPRLVIDKLALPRPDKTVHEPPRAEGKKVDRHGARRPSAAVEPAPRTARTPAEPPKKPAGKGSKRDEDPDGTLPLAE
jgi:hypothetical protein